MVVLPRHARRRGGSSNNSSHHSYNPRRDSEAYHGHPGNYYNVPPQRFFHEKTNHSGMNTTLSELRGSGYWVVQARSAVLAILR